jgi:4-carboxymuconolactone decarboxylase
MIGAVGTGEAETRQQRIPNLAPEFWSEEVKELFPPMLPPGSTAKGSDFNSILILAHHPRLADPWLRFNATVARGFTLSARLREIAILRVAWRRGSQYEWVHHTLSGLRAGLTANEISALQREGAYSWGSIEREIILATDEICHDGGISPPTLSGLSQLITTEQIMELLFVVGGYIALAAILNTADAQIEASPLEHARAAGLPMLRVKPAGGGAAK